MEDVLLLCTPIRFSSNTFSAEWHGLSFIKNYFEARQVHIKVINGENDGLTLENIMQVVEKHRPVLIGMSVTIHNYHTSYALAQTIKATDENIHICWGGAYPTASWKTILKSSRSIVDSIAYGPGESYFYEIYTALKDGRSWKEIQGVLCYTTDRLVLPHHPHVKVESDFMSSTGLQDHSDLQSILLKGGECEIIGSQGCNQGCPECDHFPQSGLDINTVKSVENIATEVDAILEKNNTRKVHLIDHHFFQSNNRATLLLQVFEERNLTFQLGVGVCSRGSIPIEELRRLKGSGLYKLTISLHFASDLKQEKQCIERLSTLGLKQKWYFDMFYPEITLDRLFEQLQLFEKYGIDQNISYLLRQAPIFEDTKQYRLYRNELKEAAIPGVYYFKYENNLTLFLKVMTEIYRCYIHPLQTGVIELENKHKYRFRTGMDKRFEQLPEIDSRIRSLSESINALFIQIYRDLAFDLAVSRIGIKAAMERYYRGYEGKLTELADIIHEEIIRI